MEQVFQTAGSNVVIWPTSGASANELVVANIVENGDQIISYSEWHLRVTKFDAVFIKGFPDFSETIDDIIAEGDKVVVRYLFTGTHKGEFSGIPPTNKQIKFTSILINRLAGGKVVERWVESNALSMLLQLGVIPLPPGYFHIKE